MAQNSAAIFSRVRSLFAFEALPRDPELPRRPRRGWLRLLFAIEPLERAAAPAAAARRTRWTRSLLAIEPLDRR
jgi:hypothetical protein